MAFGRLQFPFSDNTYERYPGVLAVELKGTNTQQLDLSEFTLLFIFAEETSTRKQIIVREYTLAEETLHLTNAQMHSLLLPRMFPICFQWGITLLYLRPFKCI